MGILRLALGEGTTNMKLFVFACLVAMATTVLDMPVTDTVLDTTDMLVLATTDTVLATTARGPLMPSPLPPLMPRLIPTTDTTALDTTATDTAADTDTTVKYPADSSHRKISLGI